MSSEGNNKNRREDGSKTSGDQSINRRNLLLGTSSLVADATLTSDALAQAQRSEPGSMSQTPAVNGSKPNILVIFGDDIGITNLSIYSNGLMGYETLISIASAAKEFSSCTIMVSSRAQPVGPPSLQVSMVFVRASPR
jgi:hypothetical protein